MNTELLWRGGVEAAVDAAVFDVADIEALFAKQVMGRVSVYLAAFGLGTVSGPSSATNDALKFSRCIGVVVHGCRIYGDWDESSFDTVTGRGFVLEYNDIIGGGGQLDGFTMKQGSHQMVIRGNKFTWTPNNPGRPAIAMGGVGKSGGDRDALIEGWRENAFYDGVVEGNLVIGTGERDILLQGASNNVVRDNVLLSDGPASRHGWFSTGATGSFDSSNENSGGFSNWVSGNNRFLRNIVNGARAGGTKE